REIQRDEALLNLSWIVREVYFDVGTHIERFKRNPIVGLELVQKYVGPIDRVIQEPAVTELAEFNQQNHGDGSVGGAKIGDRLGRTVFNDAEVLFLEAIQVVAIVIRDNNIDVHDRHGYRDSKSGLARLLLVLSL